MPKDDFSLHFRNSDMNLVFFLTKFPIVIVIPDELIPTFVANEDISSRIHGSG